MAGLAPVRNRFCLAHLLYLCKSVQSGPNIYTALSRLAGLLSACYICGLQVDEALSGPEKLCWGHYNKKKILEGLTWIHEALKMYRRHLKIFGQPYIKYT